MMVWSFGFGSGDMETGSLLDVFLFLSSLLSLLGSRPGTNGVGTGFTTCHWRWSFPRAPDLPKGCPVRYRSVAGLIDSYEYVRGTFV